MPNTVAVQISDSVFENFMNVCESDSVVAVYRVCMHETNANASSVYFEGFNENSAASQDADGATAPCIVRKMSLNGMVNRSDVTCSAQTSSLFEASSIQSHLALCVWPLKYLALPVLKLEELPPLARAVSLHIGRVYRVMLSFAIELYDVPSDSQPHIEASLLFRWIPHPYHLMFRNRVNFIYLVQHDSFCNISHMRHSDAEVLVRQWRREDRCSEGCMFFPNSTQNEGRNAAWWSTFVRWPGTVFTYYIFVDGDASLIFRRERNSLPIPHGISSDQLPFRMFERYLLQYNPAVGFPHYIGWHGDNGNDVQFVSHYDHIMIAIHHNVSRLLLPIETRFDDISWWYGQRIQGFLAAVAFSNQTLQFNAVVSENGSVGKRVALQSSSTRTVVCSAEHLPESSADAFNSSAMVVIKPCTLFFD
jgi:hypothetical protein